MKSRFLFSHKFKAVGWVLFSLGFVFGLITRISGFDFDSALEIHVIALYDNSLFNENDFFSITENGIVDELISIFIIVGGILVGFSKVKVEDEFISRIRMESLIWATYVNYGVLLFSVLFIYGMAFLDIMIYNMFTMLIFFILRFHYVLYKSNKHMRYEE